MTTLTPSPKALGLDQASRLRALFEAMGGSAIAGSQPTTQPPAPSSAARHLPIVSIASGKGGVGKTSIAVNLAITLARRGLRVTLLDGDLGVANADVMLGLNPARRLEHVLAQARSDAGSGGPVRRIGLDNIAVSAPGGFRLIPGSVGVARMADLSAAERRWLAGALCELEASADVLLVDTGAGVGPIVRTLVAASDLTLVITSPEPTAIADAYALIKCVRQGQGDRRIGEMGLVVNEARSEAEANAVHARIAMVTRRFLALDLPMLGAIAQDVRMGASVRRRKPVTLEDPHCPPAIEIGRLAQRIVQIMGLQATPPTVSKPASRMRTWLAALLRA